MTRRLILGTVLLLAACSSPSLDQETRDELAAKWQLFVLDDPSWPEAREWWLAQKPEVRDLLPLNLLKAMVSDHVTYRRQMGARASLVDFSEDAPDPDRLWRRAQAELVARPDLSLDLLVETLRRSDADVKDLMTATFARIGEPALGRLERVLAEEDEQQPRIVATNAIGRIGLENEPTRSTAEQLLIDLLREDRDWAVRGEAARALGGYSSARVVQALTTALHGDDDRFVQRKAAESLGDIGGEAAERALVAALPLAQRNRDLELLRALGRELQQLTGRRLPNDPKVWQEYLAERYGSPR